MTLMPPQQQLHVYIVYIQQRNAHMERTVGEDVKYLTGYEVRDHVESPS